MRHASAAEPKLPYKPLRHTQHGVTPYPIVNMGMEDLLRKRTHLKGVLENHWFPCHIPIPVEEDGRYNNPMYWSRNRTETHEKKNEGKALKNMLCHNRVMGKAYLDHPGKCTPTLTMYEGRANLQRGLLRKYVKNSSVTPSQLTLAILLPIGTVHPPEESRRPWAYTHKPWRPSATPIIWHSLRK